MAKKNTVQVHLFYPLHLGGLEVCKCRFWGLLLQITFANAGTFSADIGQQRKKHREITKSLVNNG